MFNEGLKIASVELFKAIPAVISETGQEKLERAEGLHDGQAPEVSADHTQQIALEVLSAWQIHERKLVKHLPKTLALSAQLPRRWET
jgi:hypothetical protein